MEQIFDELKIQGFSRHVLTELLRSTPVAIRGQETMIPRADALKIAEGDEEIFVAVLRELTAPRKVTNGKKWVSFPILTDFHWNVDRTFLSYRVNPTFLQMIAAGYR